MFPLMCGQLLMQPAGLPYNMIVGMRLMCVLLAVKSTPSHFLVKKKTILPNVLTHGFVGTKMFMKHKKCHI